MPSATDALKAACNEAYDLHGNSCSHAVWHVYKAIVNSNEQYRIANELIKHARSNWIKVSISEGHMLANQGQLVIAGAESTPNGHVVVVYPGDLKLNGGYQYFSKKTKKLEMLMGTALYPLCMSTSIGSWPGAKSRGTLTVWDPWGSNAAFSKVEFWTPGLLRYVNSAKS